MGSFSDLSPVTLKRIFQFVDAKSVFQCQLVCRQWKLPARVVAYTTLILKNNRQVLLLLQSFKDSPQLRLMIPYVKTIDFSSFSRAHYSELYLPSLSVTFPFIERLKMDHTDEKTYDQLYNIIKRSRWQYLKQIPAASCYKAIEKHNSCALLVYKNSLTDLQLTSYINSSFIYTPMRRQQVESMIQDFYYVGSHLEKFRALKRLRIRYHAHNFFINFDRQFNVPLTLTSIRVDNFIDAIPVYTNLEIREVKNYNDVEPVSSETLHLSLIRPRPNIRKLIVNFTMIDATSLEYIMRLFTNLQKLEVNDKFSSNFDYSRVISPLSRRQLLFNSLCIQSFIGFMEKIPTYRVSLPVEHAVLTRCLYNYYSKSTNPLPRSWKIVVNIAPFVCNGGSVLNMKRKRGDRSKIVLEYQSIDPAQPYLDLLKANGSFITMLSCHMLTSITENNEQFVKSGYINCLDYIFRYCPYLTHLHLRAWLFKFYYNRPEEDSISSSITHLAITQTDLRNNALGVLSIRLPHLKNLILERCQWEGSRLQQDILMPRSLFEDITIMHECDTNTLILHVDELAKKSTYYKIALDFRAFSSSVIELDKDSFYMNQGLDNSKMNIQCQSVDRIQFRLRSSKNWFTFSSSFETEFWFKSTTIVVNLPL